MNTNDDKTKAKMVRQMLATIGIKAGDAREFIELDNWLLALEEGAAVLVNPVPVLAEVEKEQDES